MLMKVNPFSRNSPTRAVPKRNRPRMTLFLRACSIRLLVAADLKGRSSSTPIVVFAHMPLWTIFEPWGWGTGDADQLMDQLRRFGSLTVLNGHIHQIVQKVEGNITFHTARSIAYPQPLAGEGAGPGPLKEPADQQTKMHGKSIASG